MESFTEMNTLPFDGILFPALIDALLNDSPIDCEIPITSPRRFHFGTKVGRFVWKFVKW